jgi:ribosome-binding protein aMBF1 (putative translation factor)
MRTKNSKVKVINFCELCGDELPEGKEKYIETRLVCEHCYNRQRKNGNRINGTKKKQDVYMKFLVKEHGSRRI